MAKNSSTPKNDFSNVPVYYADQAAGLLLGHHVSKLTFGVESEDSDSEYPRPVVTVVIPTETLIDLVSDLKLLLDSDKFKKDMGVRLERSMLKVSNGVKSSPSDYVKELLLERDIFEEVPEEPKKRAAPRKKGAKSH